MKTAGNRDRVLVAATANRGKINEIKTILQGLGIHLLTPADIPRYESPEETGTTFAENALIKAEAAFEACGLPSLADDSGLEVDALDGGPGVYSARFGGDGLSDEDRCRLLLKQLEGVPKEARTARFQAVLAVVGPGAPPAFFTGTVQGWIGFQLRGSFGFGYDPVFYLRDPDSGQFFDRSMAELNPTEKGAISHRGQAIAELRCSINDGSVRL